MEIETPHSPNQNKSWLIYMLVIGLLVVGIVTLNITGLRMRPANSQAGVGSENDYIVGDTYVRQAISAIPVFEAADSAQKAIEAYEQIGSEPAAIRRIGVVKQLLLHKSGKHEFELLGEPKQFRDVTKAESAKLASESQMWISIFEAKSLDPDRAQKYAKQIKALDLGPIKDRAIAEVYDRAGEKLKALALRNAASENAAVWIVTLCIVFMFASAAGLAGIVFCIIFLVRFSDDLKHAAAPKIQPEILLISFLLYFVGFSFIELLSGVFADTAGIGENDSVGIAIRLCLQLLSMILAFSLGVAAFKNMTTLSGEDAGEIGLKFKPIFGKILWGVAAYFAALPLLGVAAVISSELSKTVFKDVQTPEHPIVEMVIKGGAPILIVFVLAVIAAPIVEEVFFRGMLYTALRTKMGVWAAVLLSGTIFAALHPTFPGQFLPLLALAMVLALVREKTGSLLPGIVCHAINNTIALMLVFLAF
ncbi:MAG: type II CAAX endopeptidase family protein [Armatimonadetes bacterium]|nr:type II CAAX endopeptidase family protein [Armatimonadota bacterium]